MDKIYRSGIGFDVHKLVEGRKCIIGGVDIPYEKGLLGHSDADVLLHAIIAWNSCARSAKKSRRLATKSSTSIAL